MEQGETFKNESNNLTTGILNAKDGQISKISAKEKKQKIRSEHTQYRKTKINNGNTK